MCLAYFLASETPLPLTEPWSKESPRFYIGEAQLDETERLRTNLRAPFMRYVGAFTGCGCGFRLAEGTDYATTEDASAAQADHEAFAAYLSSLPGDSSAELYVCWDGDQSEKPLYRRTIRPGDIAKPEFAFHERELIAIKA